MMKISTGCVIVAVVFLFLNLAWVAVAFTIAALGFMIVDNHKFKRETQEYELESDRSFQALYDACTTQPRGEEED